MPSIAAHMVCAKLVSEKLNINDSEFIKGNLLPDIIDIKDSHNKIFGKHYYIPDIDYFVKTLDLNNNLYLGYLTHLLLDKYFLEEYIYNEVKGEEVFLNRSIYKEYDIINYRLLNKFAIDVNYLNNVLVNYNVPINKDKYNKNIRSLNLGSVDETLKYLNVDSFSNFLVETANNIGKYLDELKKEERESSILNHCFKK